MILRYTRFEKIYSSREEAITKLNNTSRYYAENVAIRYKSGEKICIMLALYQSTTKGDYTINYDSGGNSSGGGSIGSGAVKEVTRRNATETDLDALNRAYFGSTPGEGDMVIINTRRTDYKAVYFYHGSSWICLSGTDEIEGRSSATLNLSVNTDKITGLTTIYGEIPIDSSSIVVDAVTKKLRDNVIHGGNLSDLI
jgi:hypothetical protein